MNTLDRLLERNKELAVQQAAEGTLIASLPRALSNVKAIIVGCADMRVDPAHGLGIKPGGAVVMRNIGGRVTPGLLRQMGLLWRIVEVAVRFLEAVESSTSSFFSTAIAASLAWLTNPPAGAVFSSTGH